MQVLDLEWKDNKVSGLRNFATSEIIGEWENPQSVEPTN
jgi:hypothetical protein